MQQSPGLDPPTDAQRWIVGNGLPGVAPGNEVTVEALVAALGWAARNRLTGLLFQAVTGIGAAMPEELSESHLTSLRQGLAVEAEACRAVAALRVEGIDPVVFKGVASAHLDHADPGDRTFYDVDLLVRRDSFGAAAEHLAAAGWARTESALGSRWEAQYGRAAQFVSPSGVEVDLHAALAAGYFGVRLDHGALLRASQKFELGGIEVTSFDADARLLASCYALVLSRGGSIRLVRDVAQQLIVTGACWERAVRLAGEGDVVIAAAIRTVDDWIDLPAEVVDWAQSIDSSPRQRRGLEAARRAETSGWRSDVAGELLGLGNLQRIDYVAGVAAHRIRRLVRR